MAASLVLAAAPPLAAAQGPLPGITPEELFPEARFDPAIPTQLEVLGVQHGQRPIRHDELMRYLRALDEASPRMRITPYARTHEDREMVYLAIGEPEMIAELDGFRADHAARTDPRGRAAGDDAALLEGAKAVAWMAYGIHGDELSSVDAAAALAYWLVAGEDEAAATLRRELVTLIDPCENPDGRDRFLAQTRSFGHRRPNPDLEDLSHTTVWPWGRGNHYLFDLNRDWFSMVQPESARSGVIASWNPQLMVDSHEMGANDTYLFSPPRHPFNPHLPPSHHAWWQRFAADQARALDARGYPYYTREWNEEFFPGYGSSWSSYLGAIGILYEMSGTEGTLVRQRSGGVRTYAQATEHQLASSVANLQTLADNRAEILADFVNDRRQAIEAAGRGPVTAWVLPEGRHPERTRKLVALLRAQGIEVLGGAAGSARVAGLRDARTGESVDPASLSGALWLARVDQPAGPLVRQLLDPHVPMEAAFFREQREHLERGKGSRLYEITAWSLPLSYGVEAYWTAESPGEGWSEVAVDEAEGTLELTPRPFGYLIDGVADPVAPALAGLLQRGITIRVAEKPFRVDGADYTRGTLLIQCEGNPDDVEAQLAEVARRHDARIRAVSTAKAESGPDLGGRYFHPLVAPRVGVWTGSPVSPSAYGALWHLLDEQLDLRFAALDVSQFGRKDLGRYNVLVFPPVFGGANVYRRLIGSAGVERLKRWIEAGGTVIGIGGGAEFLADEGTELTRTRLRRQALDRYPPVVLGPAAELAEAGGPFRAVGARAPEKAEPDEGKDDQGKKKGDDVIRSSPYDVAPILGPGAAPFAEGHDQGTPVPLVPVDLADWVKPFLPPAKTKPEAEDLERADRRLRTFASRGTFMRLEIDGNVWMAWGLPEELPALALARDTLVAEAPVQVAARFADIERLHLGGLLWPETAGRMANTAYVTREAVGRGQVILFLNEPEFRGWTLGTRRLLLNALLLGPGMGTRWSTPW
jgi:hypothetical protein